LQLRPSDFSQHMLLTLMSCLLVFYVFSFFNISWVIKNFLWIIINCPKWGGQELVANTQLLQVVCGKRAGAFTCLLDESGRYDSPDYATVNFKPDFKVSSLTEVHSLLEEHFDLAPWSPNLLTTKALSLWPFKKRRSICLCFMQGRRR